MNAPPYWQAEMTCGVFRFDSAFDLLHEGIQRATLDENLTHSLVLPIPMSSNFSGLLE